MHMLSMRLRNWCMRWAYTSETDVFIEHMHQEQICVLSTRIRKSCVHWAYYASGTRVCFEHTTHQELVSALSILHIRNTCVLWAYYASGTYACTEHTHQELMHALSIHIRYLWTHWAYASGTYACSEHTHQLLMDALSICAKNLYTVAELTHQFLTRTYAPYKRKNSKLEKVPSRHAEHTRKELMHASRNYGYEHWTACA